MPSATEVVTPKVTLRTVTSADRELLCAVYRSSREAELAAVPWEEPAKAAFVRQQFDAQDRGWAAQRPHAVRDIVLVAGEPAGRLYVERTAEGIHVVDITLLPEHRGHGVGHGLLGLLLDEGDCVGLPVTLLVERHNPALRLYERLGFEVVEDLGVHLSLRRPSRQAKTAS
jgi:ribosomal protein S18 acetylase RimI-like enzyme